MCQPINGIKIMKRDLTVLVKAVEKKFGQSVTMATDFEKLAFAFARQHVTLHPTALKQLWMLTTDGGFYARYHVRILKKLHDRGIDIPIAAPAESNS